ncbi:MAG: hypothetical protein WCB15_31775 [Desulfobacterales bacterium]|jgi:hypothetical protein
MTAMKNPESALEKLCNAAIERRLGDLSGLPKELGAYIVKVYREFISSYLNMLRQRENKPTDWTPETLSIEPELTDGMRHFFSDYQHIAKEFNRLNLKMDRLQEIDKDNQGNLYQHTIDDILKQFNLQATMRQ